VPLGSRIGFSSALNARASASGVPRRWNLNGKIFSSKIICKIFRDARAFNYAILRAPLCPTLPVRAPLCRVACKYARATLFDGFSTLSIHLAVIRDPRESARSRGSHPILRKKRGA